MWWFTIEYWYMGLTNHCSLSTCRFNQVAQNYDRFCHLEEESPWSAVVTVPNGVPDLDIVRKPTVVENFFSKRNFGRQDYREDSWERPSGIAVANPYTLLPYMDGHVVFQNWVSYYLWPLWGCTSKWSIDPTTFLNKLRTRYVSFSFYELMEKQKFLSGRHLKVVWHHSTFIISSTSSKWWH